MNSKLHDLPLARQFLAEK